MNTPDEKESRMSIRVDEVIRDEFHAAARVRGTRAATLLHQYMVNYIKAVKKEDPEDFTEKLAIVLAEKEAEGTKRLEKKQRKGKPADALAEENAQGTAEVKASANKARFDALAIPTQTIDAENILIDDNFDFDGEESRYINAEGHLIDKKTGKRIHDLRIDKDYIPEPSFPPNLNPFGKEDKDD